MTFRRRLLPLFLAALTLPLSQAFFQGCATWIDGPTEKVHVKSQPAGAQVLLNGHAIGQTPLTTRVSRWGVHRVRIEMPGYKPFEVPLQKTVNGYVSGNLFIGGVWIVVDALTGAVFQLDVPPDRKAELLKDQGYGAIFSPTTLTISVALKPDPTARKIGQMQRKQ
jgi:hypothetical protein